MTLRDGETGVTETFVVVGTPFAPGELSKWKGATLSVEVRDQEDSQVMDFEVLKTPRQFREEGLKEFAPLEQARLRGLIQSAQGIEVSSESRPGSVEARDAAVSQARETLAAFEKKYARFLPAKKEKKKARKSTEEN
jgi:hypothetical protein